MRRGKQLVVLTQGKNVKRYVAGALNARTGKVIHVARHRKNSDLFIALIGEPCRHYRRARRLHLVLDNFLIQQVQADSAPPRGTRRLRGVPLPCRPTRRCPTVIERLSKQLHDHVTASRRVGTGSKGR